MFTKLYSVFFLCIFYGLPVAVAQEEAAKFGKVSEAELRMKSYEKDTSAAAVVLSDFGYSYFTTNGTLKLMFERHTRIKILKKSGYDWANVELPYYRRNADKEVITSIKGFTYNLENGKITKDKLESKAVFDEKINENLSQKKFTLPNVKEGSVIEFSYTVTSDFIYTLNSWEFQTTIPTMWSEYRARIPEYFDYKFLQNGYHNFYTTKKDAAASANAELRNEAYVWAMKDVPALQEEKYITTLKDYQARLDFELQLLKVPGEFPKVMTGNWDEVIKKLMEEERFGTQLKRSGFFKNEIAAIKAKHTSPQAQVEAIYELVKSAVKWNGKQSIYTTSTTRKAFDNRTGNSADVNMLLTAMLLEADIDASPVLLSTRRNGRVTKGSPLITQFNYVIAYVKVDEKEYLLDATDPMLPAGMLPYRCLNGDGYLINRTSHRWVPLKPTGNYTTFCMGELAIDAKGEIKGKISESNTGYSALSLRESIKEEGKEKFAEKRNKEIGDMKYGEPTITNLEELDKALNLVYEITGSGNGQANDLLYLNPMLNKGEKENPFKLAERMYPVDFGYPYDETFMCKIAIPEGYEVDETPKSIAVSLPNNGGKFTYIVERRDAEIQVMSKINISKPLYFAEEYPYLKEFYNQIVAKHAEQIVLKKKYE
ncbi:DUF3857 domain-containing protein [Pontibacter beigongshangensis]|uniref:DUF3857 domain-containing protein n=1 Tax=Pontibacter beigongshangensis TaxID=2574733 RepID=UPI0016509939|nr:DUF3857 domain-containing protein [Pontibacter beigongshangensis]